MSNHWDLHCRDCDETCELHWKNGGDQLQQLISHLPDIAKMPDVEDLLSGWFVSFGFPHGLARFAAKHHTHDVVAIDEYGTFHGHCIERYECSCCGSRQHCRKPRGHDGECGPARRRPFYPALLEMITSLTTSTGVAADRMKLLAPRQGWNDPDWEQPRETVTSDNQLFGCPIVRTDVDAPMLAVPFTDWVITRDATGEAVQP